MRKLLQQLVQLLPLCMLLYIHGYVMIVSSPTVIFLCRKLHPHHQNLRATYLVTVIALNKVLPSSTCNLLQYLLAFWTKSQNLAVKTTMRNFSMFCTGRKFVCIECIIMIATHVSGEGRFL